MFAVIQSGGRQVRVVPGTVVTVDRLAAEPGQEVHFERVLLVGPDGSDAKGEVVVGRPFVANVRVVGTVENEVRGPKIRVFKMKRRKGYRRTTGHRATLTRVAIREIVTDQ
ncbi:MAG: 50S ribosomal protein L21 [Luteitalea sp.]|nr:50S ribosomal protein L21 [Luteitalea sp.]